MMPTTYQFSDYNRDKIPHALQGLKFARNHVKVAGLQFRRTEALKFLDGAIQSDRRGWRYGVHLRREPGNVHDPSAIAVDGYWTEKRLLSFHNNSLHIGYVPAEYAKAYSKLADDGAVLAGQLKNCWIGKEGGIAIDIAIYASMD